MRFLKLSRRNLLAAIVMALVPKPTLALTEPEAPGARLTGHCLTGHLSQLCPPPWRRSELVHPPMPGEVYVHP
jgi:hypothetical protein